jgi:hypothetical protein
MGFGILPLLVVVFFAGFLARQNDFVQSQSPDYQIVRAQTSGVAFLRYRDSVYRYLEAHPGYSGSVPAGSLDEQFSAEFLSKVGNLITPTASGGGTVITCYAAIPANALADALARSENDASFGISNGSTWTSMASGVSQTPAPLSVAIPNGNVVSVVQIGV